MTAATDLEPCPTCRRMSTASHRAVCLRIGGRPAAPAPSRAPAPWEGSWSVDASGTLYDPEGAPWEGDEDPPGIDVRGLPLRPGPGARRAQDAPPSSTPDRPPTRSPRRARRSAASWTPLPPPLPHPAPRDPRRAGADAEPQQDHGRALEGPERATKRGASRGAKGV